MKEKEPPRSDSFPETQNENVNSFQNRAKRKDDKHTDCYFAKLPREIAQATTRTELDVNELGILAFIIAAADWRTNQYVAPSLRALKDTLGWPFKEDALRKRLDKLRTDGWLEFESTQGKRSAYGFRLGQRYYDSMALLTLDGTSARTPPPRTEVTSDDIPFGESAIPLPEKDNSIPQAQPGLLSKNENENESNNGEQEHRSSEGDEVGEARQEDVPIYRRGFTPSPLSDDEL